MKQIQEEKRMSPVQRMYYQMIKKLNMIIKSFEYCY